MHDPDRTIDDPGTPPAALNDATVPPPPSLDHDATAPPPPADDDATVPPPEPSESLLTDLTVDAAPEGTVGLEDVGRDMEQMPATAVDRDRTRAERDPRTVRAGKGPLRRQPRERQVAGYEILGELGRGGMGVVYKARHQRLNRIVALKMILSGEHAGADQLARFRIEAEAVAHLQHPNIVQVYDVGEDQGCPYFSLEFVEGETLSARIETAPQPPREAARIVQALASAMHLAHQRGIVHRDLKPANVLMSKDNVPKITDFGLAKRFEEKDTGQTRTGAIMGTPSYMAPEQAQGRSRHVGPSSDIYSLGAILYDLLTGRPPFRGTTVLETLQQVSKLEPVPPKSLQPHVPRDLETICLKALEKDPARRYLTAGALADDLDRYLNGVPILARPTPLWERGWKWARRRPTLAALVGVSTIAVTAIVVFGALWLDSERRAAEERERQQTQLAEFESERAEKEGALRKHAEKNFRRAMGAVDEMLSRVGQENLAHIPQMERVRHQLLEKALAFYKEFRDDKADDPKIRWENARAQRRVADILDMMGRQPKARDAYLSALGLYHELVRDFPDNADYRHDLAATANNLGHLFEDIKLHPEAEKAYREALALNQDLTSKYPDRADYALELAKNRLGLSVLLQLTSRPQDAERELLSARDTLEGLVKRPESTAAYRLELARCLDSLGVLQKTLGKNEQAEKRLHEAHSLFADLAGAFKEVPEYRQYLALNHQHLGELYRDSAPDKSLKHYQRAQQLRSELSTSFPGFPVFRQELANTFRNLALLHQAQGRQQMADQAYEKSLDIQDRLAKDFPHVPDYRRYQASSLNNRAIMLFGANRAKEGEKALEEAQKIFAGLSKEHPDVTEYDMELANILFNRGTVCQSTGRAKEAEDFYHQALAIRRRLVQHNAAIVEHRQELATVLMNLATLLQVQRPDDAEKAYTEARKIFADLSSRAPGNAEYRFQQAIAGTNLGHLYRQRKEEDKADAAWKDAVELLERLTTDFAEESRYPQELARALNQRAIFLLGANRLDDASATWQRAIDVQTKLVAAHPGRVELRIELASSLGNLGVLHTRANRVVEAEKAYRRAIALLEEPEGKIELSPNHARELIHCHKNLAALLQSLSRPAEAESSWLRILAVQEALVKQYPRSPDFALEIVATLNELGNRLVQKDKFADARDYYQKAVTHLLPWTKDPATTKTFTSSLYLTRLNLATSVVGVGDHQAAAQVIEQAAPLDDKASQHQHLAALLARCMSLAEKDAKLADAKRRDLIQSYGDRAMKLLDAAVAHGFRDGTFLKSDEFAPLRARPDFQKFARTIGERGASAPR